MTHASRTHSAITQRPLAVDEAGTWVADPRAGATVVFTGVVRDHADGRAVVGLTYEAYREHAETQLTALLSRTTTRWPDLCALWVEHRVGSLSVGEPAVVVAASAPHRAEAFAAAAWTIDTLKDEVAIWKQEHWADGGSHWPGSGM